MLQITDEIWQEQIRDGKLTLLYLATEKVLALLQNSQKCDVLHFFYTETVNLQFAQARTKHPRTQPASTGTQIIWYTHRGLTKLERVSRSQHATF